MPTMVGEAAFSMTGCVRSLHTKNRTLVADGFGDSLQHIRDILPLRYHRYPSGSTAWTWTIPQRWDFRDAFVALESSGEKVIDASRCLLHLHIGSTPVDTVVTREELLAHLAYRDDLPDAIPYVTRYYDGGWGFSVRKANLEAIVGHAAGERFRVVVDTSLDDGVMLVGEVTVPGYGEATILFPIHLDHPWQCNDNLSGCAVAIELALRLGRVPDLRHSYRFLFVPETIGTIAFCARHPDVLKTVKYGIVVDSVGTAGPLRVMAARDAGSILNRYALAALRTVTPWQGDDALRHVGFYDYEHFVSANDERMLQVPGVDIPSVAISRYPFKEYHTDQDTPSIISEDKLEETLAVLMEMVRLIEEDFRPRQTYPGMLCLSAYGLYDASWSIEEKLSIEKTLYLLTGELSAFEIAEKVEAPFDFVAGFLRKLQAQALVEAV
jgi:aminopeptidase-like protein